MMAGSPSPLIALINANPASVPPVEAAFAKLFPEARLWSILDDRLLQDAEQQGGVDEGLRQRMRRLIAHAVGEAADGILLTCSLYGCVAHDMASELEVPIYGPDDAVFAAVLGSGLRRVQVVGSVELSVRDSMTRLAAAAAAAAVDLEITPVFVAEAFAASKAGDADGLARAVAATASSIGSPADCILLAQYSLAPAAARVEQAVGIPVFSGPERSAMVMRGVLRG